MKKAGKYFWAWTLVFALLLSASIVPGMADAAAKLKLSVSKVTLDAGSSKTVKVKNAPSGSKITWSSKDTGIAKVSKSGKITAVKEGNTTVTAKVVYKTGKKKTTKKLVVKVTVKASADAQTPVPAKTPAPEPDASTVTTAPTDTETTNLTTEHKSANGITTKDNGLMRKNWTSAEYMNFMGQGWNLGNTMESCGKELPDTYTAKDFEKFWGAPETTQKTIDGIHSYGVNTVRIPVAWSNMMSSDGKYTINNDYFNRVEEIINYVLNNGMYAIVNIHYDSDWWGQFGDADASVREQAWARFESFWTQIANRYKEYSDRLVFESANEELGERLNDNWVKQDANKKTGTLTTDEQYQVTNQINQKFVDIVRSTGGNNKYRYLLIAGFDTNIDKTCDDRFIMPKDTVTENGNTKLSVSVHYYDPSVYCIAESATNSWGYADTWGTNAEIRTLRNTLAKMSKFTEQGYGVIIGEYGVCNASKDGVPKFFEEVMTYGAKSGFVPVMWDTGIWYDRISGEMKYKDIAEVFNKVTGSKGVISDNAETTGIPSIEYMPEDGLKTVYTWEGSWTRTEGSEAIPGGYELKSCDDGLNIQSNSAFWQLWANTDWSSMTKPCIKVTMASDEVSQNADLQVAYTTEADGPNWKGAMNPQTDWIGKCIPLNTELLKENKWLMFSSNKPGATIIKIEILDAK